MKSVAALALSCVSLLLIADTSVGQGQIYCGRRLAETLAYLCDNPLINRPGLIIKRTSYDTIMSDDFAWPWIPHRQAKGMRNKRQTVTSECCDKPCTLNELLTYCSY
ncbi:bombyxin A-3 homolog [Zerene cesonia]|uniref:bombyxin A-3 homolog n=1 Tax=Zerene cesonia TaxID=33412 RepID=UPI0018E522ED|nr:bombyxin A-3 homolog [Zerene cesonia]